jgi:thiamine-phosphate diphosphorylase
MTNQEKNKKDANNCKANSHPLLSGLYLIIDTDVVPSSLEKTIDVINQSNINIVQYRNKAASKKTIFKNASTIKQKLSPHKLFIINDHIDIALDLGDGVHIGQDDYPIERIRSIVPHDFIVGISCHDLKEAQIAMEVGASYIAIGCLFATKSKNDVVPVSLSELQKVCDIATVPVCAIGGINMNNLDKVLTADIKMAALISYVWQTDAPLRVINEMHEKIIKKSASDVS